MNAVDLIKILEEQVARLRRMEAENIAGFAIIVPPEGDPIHFTLWGSPADEMSFFKLLSDKLVGVKERNQYGGVRMPPGVR